ncbi:Rv1733c family protein [Streptomyces hokutonensis]|uniref:Rv1733c family protein n=1 Tax=Streptomyces hokutonensis TaxID=1306990 RepID=UPI000475E5BA|nr:hypothetical protein [Streptomyces hokutonensis]
MRKTTRTRVRGWQWRPNELRRHSDVLEARIVLLTWALAVAGGVAAGIAGADAMEGVVERQRAQTTPVSALLVREVPASTRNVETGAVYGQVVAEVRWTDQDGAVRTDWTKADPGTKAGAALTVWTDGHGHLGPSPISQAHAAGLLALTGASTAAAGGALVLLGGRAVRRQVEERATECWGTEWGQVGPGWEHKTG